jgi:hypothetical protein
LKCRSYVTVLHSQPATTSPSELDRVQKRICKEGLTVSCQWLPRSVEAGLGTADECWQDQEFPRLLATGLPQQKETSQSSKKDRILSLNSTLCCFSYSYLWVLAAASASVSLWSSFDMCFCNLAISLGSFPMAAHLTGWYNLWGWGR